MKKRVISCLVTGCLALSMMATSVWAGDAETADTKEAKEFDMTNVPEGGYTVALCNFSLGNTWRVQMEKTFEQQAEMYKEMGLIKEYYTTNSDGDTSQQVSDMQDLVTKGVDIICLTAASPTALIPAVMMQWMQALQLFPLTQVLIQIMLQLP